MIHVICGGCSSIGRAPDCGSGRCGFESHHPPQTMVGDRGSPGPLLLSTLGRRQGVRQGTLTPSSAGSSPAVPATPSFVADVINIPDPVAQSAEQLPFKQWVRGSNPRRVTTSEQAVYRLLRLFYKSQSALIPLFLLSNREPLRWGRGWFWMRT